MRVHSNNRRTLIGLAAVLVVGGLLVMVILVNPSRAIGIFVGVADEAKTDQDTQREGNPPLKHQPERKKSRADEVREELERLDAIAAKENAYSSHPELQKAIVAGLTEEVQLHAYELSYSLALGESLPSQLKAVKSGLDAPSPVVQKQAVADAAEYNDAFLVESLIHIAEGKAGFQASAMWRLADIEDERAATCLLRLAQDESLDRPTRCQAIALLAKSGGRDELEFLSDLSQSDDEEYRRLAVEVINSINLRRMSGD